MRYTVTLNGKKYELDVERVSAAPAQAAPAGTAQPVRTVAAYRTVRNAPAAAPAPAQVPAAPVSAPAASAAGGVKVVSPMPGTILEIKAAQGQSIHKGDTVFVLEAMKMEVEVVAPETGTVASINAAKGDAVETDQVLATLN